MSSMENTEQRRRRPRSFTDEYKAEVVELCRTSGKTLVEIARDLDLTPSTVSRWCAQAEVDAGRRQGITTTEREEIARLKKELRVAREERDILKRATAFFARETR
jgi:transposase